MISFIPIIGFFLLCSISLTLSYTIGIFSSPDTYSFYYIGNFVLNNLFHPFHIGKLERLAATLHTPIYGVIINLIISIPYIQQAFLLALFQQILLLFAVFMLYRLLRHDNAILMCCLGSLLFYFFPFQLIYSSLLFSETFTSALITLFLFVLYKILVRQNIYLSLSLFFLGFVLFFTHFSLIAFTIVGTYILWKHIVKDHTKKTLLRTFFVIVPISIFTLWWINLHIISYGSARLSIVSGRHLYNSVVVKSKLLPKINDIQTQKFLSYVSSPDDVYKPWWETQLLFKDLNESIVDDLYFHYAYISLKQNFTSFIVETGKTIVVTFITPPYLPKKPESFYAYPADNCSLRCRTDFQPSLCTERPKNCNTFTLWKSYIDSNRLIYPVVGILSLVTIFLGFGIAIKQKNIFGVYIGILTVGSIMFISATEIVESRHIIPFYSVIIYYGVYLIHEGKKFFSKKLYSIRHNSFIQLQ